MAMNQENLAFCLDELGAEQDSVAVLTRDGKWVNWHFMARWADLPRPERMQAEAGFMLRGGTQAVRVLTPGGEVVTYGETTVCAEA